MAEGLRPGDWYCPNCNDLQFGRNLDCRRCGTSKHATPSQLPLGGAIGQMRLGQLMGTPSFGGTGLTPGIGGVPGQRPAGWTGQTPVQTPQVGKHGFTGIVTGGQESMPTPGAAASSKPGDWACVLCNQPNPAVSPTCFNCGLPSPAVGLAILGDWSCLACTNVNYIKDKSCQRCGKPKPGEEGAQARRYTERSEVDPRQRSPRRSRSPRYRM